MRVQYIPQKLVTEWPNEISSSKVFASRGFSSSLVGEMLVHVETISTHERSNVSIYYLVAGASKLDVGGWAFSGT